MAEHAEESLLLQDDSLPDKSSDGANRSSSDRDLHDTFSLFKLYMDGKMDSLESKLVREQDAMSKKIKEEVSIKFKHEGNRIQFKFNNEVSIRVVLDLLDKVKGHNQQIRISDFSPAGWSTVREYESNGIASDSKDEKKIRQAESRAMRTVKDNTKGRPAPYSNKPRLPPAETYANPTYNQQFQRQPFRNSVARRVTDILRNKDRVLKHLEPSERTISWEMYHQNRSHSWKNTGSDATYEGNKMPVCRSIYYRVEGEDVDITCKINNTNGLVGVKNYFIDFHLFSRFEWDLGKNLTDYSLKLLTKVKVKNTVEMVLRITDLTAGYLNHEIILWGIFKTSSKQTFRVKFGSFFINKQKEIFNYIHVPQGHIVSLNAMPFYSFSETDDHFVFHNISSIVDEHISGDTNAVCSDIFKGCGPMIHVLYNMSKVVRINKNPLPTEMKLNSYSVATKPNETGIQIAKSYTCVCENGYGQHTYSIFRNLYNTSSKSEYISEIKLPYKFFILPRD
ncbi:unnamed protein product [Mytilus edulis]|uniref:Uncharacterized protein n=1 Tax=Mytilus edulis TaxID=6550 RepID=A0A8S3R1B4_MYTED|nr:unnamed protein product [Mytilus edulis]